MLYTTKYALKKPELIDTADLRVFVGDNMDILDTHTHDWADITTGKPTTFPPPLMSTSVVGGALVGNGLGMSGSYLFVKTATADGTKINTAGAYNVAIDRAVVDTWYAPATHTHDWETGITGKPTTFTPPLASATVVGGHRVGNGLTMSGEYLLVRTGSGLEINTTTFAVDIDRDIVNTWYAPAGNYIISERTGSTTFVDSIWKGTQAEYDVLTKDPNTIYYIVG